jgi:hypothetical protein
MDCNIRINGRGDAGIVLRIEEESGIPEIRPLFSRSETPLTAVIPWICGF